MTGPTTDDGLPAPAPGQAAVLAADVGNSKTDLALVAADGSVLAAVRGATTSHQAVGIVTGMRRLAALAGFAARAAGLDESARPLAPLAVVCAAGADTPSDRRRLRRALGRTGLAPTVLLRNDTDAALRAGSDAGWGVAVICGAGVNCLGVAPDGRTSRLFALGDLTGDWGGGEGVAKAGLAAAIRGRDGRGPRTSLERTLPIALGLRRPVEIAVAVYERRIHEDRLRQLAPLVFDAAADGDVEARAIVDHLADELVAMARASIRRLHISRLPVPIVLAGGVFGTSEAGFHDRLLRGLHAAAPRARVVRLEVLPVTGAALLGLDVLGGGSGSTPAAADARARAGLRGDAITTIG